MELTKGSSCVLTLLGSAGFVLSSCGSAEEIPPPMSCDGGGSVAFGFQVISSYEPGVDMNVENGSSFLFVDGACNYWAFSLSHGTYDYWGDVATGRLTSEQLGRFNRDLVQLDWRAIAERPVNVPTVDHPAPTSAWYGDRVGACLVPCDDHPVGGIRTKVDTWIEELYQTGEQLPPSTPLRWLVQRHGDDVSDSSWRVWTGTSRLASAATPDAEGPGDYAFAPEPDWPLLRALRDENRKGTSYLSLPLVDEGLGYYVNFREALPIEDEHGLVRPPKTSGRE